MTGILTEGQHTAEYIINENGTKEFCRRQVTFAGSEGDIIEPGAVVGASIQSADALIEAASSNTGDADLSAVVVTFGALVQQGLYTLVCTDVSADEGTFEVHAPFGQLDDLTVGTAYESELINLTIPDGVTDWAEGDTITITVVIDQEQYKVYNPNDASGAKVATAIAYSRVEIPASGSARGVASVRSTVVRKQGLVWPDAVTAEQKAAAYASLDARGIVPLD